MCSAMWKLSCGKSVIQFCRETGARYSTIWKNINTRNMSVDDACALAIKNRGRKDSAAKFLCGDLTLRSYCAQKGISYQRVYLRIKKGFDIKEALRLVENKQKAIIS